MPRSPFLVAAIAALLSAAAVRAEEPVYTGWFSDLAVGGHDVVAYFTRGEAVEGSAEYSMQWRGAVWHFASEDHLQRFREDPSRYAPAYGGYCAYAVARGTTAAGDPDRWAIHDGRLYLTYDADAQSRWKADAEAHIATADEHWSEMVERVRE